MWDMTHSYVRHDSFICATWLIHMCDMTHSYVRHDWFIWVTRLIHIHVYTYSYSYAHRKLLIEGAREESVASQMWSAGCWLFICVTHSYVWHDSFLRATCLVYISICTYICIVFLCSPQASDRGRAPRECLPPLPHTPARLFCACAMTQS